MIHPLHSLIAGALLCATFTVHGQPIVSEVRVTPQGALAQIVISIYNYDVVIDSLGVIQHVESMVDKNLVSSLTLQKDAIKQKNGRNLEFPNGKITSIHDMQILYSHSAQDRIERLGDLKFVYLGKENKISQVGCLEIKYEAASGKLESVGLVRFYYDYSNNRISEATVIERSACSARVRILHQLSK